MRKTQGLFIITLAIIILLSSITTSSLASSSKANIQFKDTKSTDWYMPTVLKLVELKGIAGFPDGTFRPTVEISKGEFIKILVGSLGFDEGPSITGGHWASNYRRRAVLIGLIDATEFNKLDEAISRYEMSKVIVKAVEYKGESHVENRDKFIGQIKDYNNVPNEYRDYVLKAYTKGLISGYPDGEFKGSRGLSRAEASAVIIRVLDPTERKLPTETKESIKTKELTEEDIKRLQGYEIHLVGRAMGFEESYKNYKEDLEAWANEFNPKNFGVYKNASEVEWITSPKTIYRNALYPVGIRGILRVKYDTENNESLIPGKYYERDVTFYMSNSDNRDGTTTVKLGQTNYLSPWKEVK